MMGSPLGDPVDRLPVRGRKQWATNLLLGALAAEFVGSSMLVPIMAQYAASFDVDKGLVGLVFSASSLSTLLSDLWLPHVSDGYGRKPAIILSLVGTSVAYAMEAAAPTFRFLLIAAFVGGMFGGTPPVAVAYISDIYPPAERPQYIGYVPALISICFIVGPSMGGFIANFSNSFRFPIALSAAVCGLLALPLVVFMLPDSKQLLRAEEKKDIVESNEVEKLSEKSEPRLKNGESNADETSGLLGDAPTPATDYPGPWKDYRCWVCLVRSLIGNTVFSAFVVSIPLVLAEPSIGLGSEQDAVFYTGLICAASATVQFFGLAVVFNVIQKKVGLPHTVHVGSSISFLAMVIISFQTSVVGIGAGWCFFALGNCLTRPAYQTYLTNIVPTEYVARAIAMPSIASNVAGLVAPLGATMLLGKTDHHVLYRYCAVGMFLQLALVLLCLRDEKEDKEADKSPKDIEGVPDQTNEEQFVQELVALLKHRNYDLDSAKSQKIIMAIAKRSFPYLSCDGGDCEKLVEELHITDCKKAQAKMKRRTIVRQSSALVAGTDVTQLGD